MTFGGENGRRRIRFFRRRPVYPAAPMNHNPPDWDWPPHKPRDPAPEPAKPLPANYAELVREAKRRLRPR